MNLISGTQQFVGNNPLALGQSGKPVRVFSIELVSGGGGASKLVLYNSTTTTADSNYAQVDGTTSKGVTVNYLVGKRFPNGCYVATDANTAYASITFTQEF